MNHETLTKKEEKSLREYLDKTFRKKIKEKEEVYKKKERAKKSSLSIKIQYSYGILQSFYNVISKILVLRKIRNKAALQICKEVGWDLTVKSHMEEEKLERLRKATELKISDGEIKELEKITENQDYERIASRMETLLENRPQKKISGF